eukprot:193944-Pyramimonas_sp.AAC.2
MKTKESRSALHRLIPHRSAITAPSKQKQSVPFSQSEMHIVHTRRLPSNYSTVGALIFQRASSPLAVTVAYNIQYQQYKDAEGYLVKGQK